MVVAAFTNAGVQLDQTRRLLQGSNVGAGGRRHLVGQPDHQRGAGDAGLRRGDLAAVQRAPGARRCDLRPNPRAPFIAITSPVADAILQPTFNVTGVGTGLGQGAVVVHARNSVGTVLAQASTTVPGGNGQWSVVLTVNTPPNTAGVIYVFWQPNPNIATSVPVRFGGAAPPQDYISFLAWPMSDSRDPGRAALRLSRRPATDDLQLDQPELRRVGRRTAQRSALVRDSAGQRTAVGAHRQHRQHLWQLHLVGVTA